MGPDSCPALHFGSLKLFAPDSSRRLERSQLLAVAQGFGDVEAGDLFTAIKIGEGSGHPQDPGIAPCQVSQSVAAGASLLTPR